MSEDIKKNVKEEVVTQLMKTLSDLMKMLRNEVSVLEKAAGVQLSDREKRLIEIINLQGDLLDRILINATQEVI